jgi:glycosyltransferase involved in cell wall biosynthesis
MPTEQHRETTLRGKHALSPAASEIGISVVTPVYKAPDCLPELYRRLVAVLERIGEPFEILLVNDASPDNSWQVIEGLAQRDPRVRGINLSRNFGQHYAITAGLDHARGRFVVVMDCDLQHVPEDIPRLYEKAREGYDIVFVRRVTRRDTFLKKLSSRAFTTLYNTLTDFRIDPRISTYSIISRRVADAVRRLSEGNRNYALLLHWVGFDMAYIDGEHAERFAGRSAYSFRKLFAFAIDSITGQSNRPMRLSIQFGFCLSIAAQLYAVWLALRYFIWQVPVEGWTSLMVAIFFLSGLMFANIGVLGVYLGKVFDESRHRPLYVVKDRLNFDAETSTAAIEPIALRTSAAATERPFDRARVTPPA